MDFFYPNLQNDMWRIFGHIFFHDKEHFLYPDKKAFNKELIVDFLNEKGIALYDTATSVRRLQDNASDKFLEIVTPTDIEALLREIPKCHAIVTTGQKATDVIVDTYGCEEPEVGSFTNVRIGSRDIRFWRMPSSSRAYPLPLEKKAEPYRKMYETENIA